MAATSLSNLASTLPEGRAAVAAASGASVLLERLRSSTCERVRERAASALANLMCHPPSATTVASSEGLGLLVRCLVSSSSSGGRDSGGSGQLVQNHAALALGNICRMLPERRSAVAAAALAEALTACLRCSTSSDAAKKYSAWGLGGLADGRPENGAVVVAAGGVAALQRCMFGASAGVRGAASVALHALAASLCDPETAGAFWDAVASGAAESFSEVPPAQAAGHAAPGGEGSLSSTASSPAASAVPTQPSSCAAPGCTETQGLRRCGG